MNLNIRMILKGLFCLSFKSHILDSNGVWYSWFWPEGSINAQNSTFLGFHFVPRDLDLRRHKGLRLAAPWDLDSNQRRRESRFLGTKWKPKLFEFWSFIDPSGQNQLYHTPLLSKIWDLNNGKKMVNNPFNMCKLLKVGSSDLMFLVRERERSQNPHSIPAC